MPSNIAVSVSHVRPSVTSDHLSAFDWTTSTEHVDAASRDKQTRVPVSGINGLRINVGRDWRE
ncbi:hypothetical protein ACE6H2_017458 [Prunus campanulata]